MTILKGKYRVKNSENGYDVVHLETSASQVKFNDGKSFQDKLNSGELKGDKGDTGAKGDKGETGASGKDGLTTSVTVDGVKYTHVDGNIILPKYPTLSSLGAEPSNPNIQEHISSIHAPSDAQKNSDITKDEIEAKLTGTISTHTHDYSNLINKPDLSVYATQTYVSDKVADLVGSAPETLDTLKELADALGNDPNFATTVANQIGAKADKSSVYTKSEVDKIIGSSTSINDNTVNESNTWSSQKINTELNNKVDKEAGKGLSTNDFTTEEKDKLANLSNYVHPDTEDMRHVTDDEKLAWNSKAEENHRHSFSDIDNLPICDVTKEYVDQELNKKSDIHTHPYKADDYVPSWDEVTGKPKVFEPSSHDHNDMYYDKNAVDKIIDPISDDYIDELFENLDDIGNPIDFYSKDEADAKFATKEELDRIDFDTSHLATKEELSSLNSLVTENTGDLNSLQTENKDNLVGAINELFQDVDSGKQLIADAIDNDNVTKDSTFEAMSDAIKTEFNTTKSRLYELMSEGGYNVNSNMSTNEMLELLELSGINLTDIKQIVCGDISTYILKKDGSLYSCGYNNSGQLGLNSTATKYTFTQVTMNINNDVNKIACKYRSVYAIKNDGSLWVCGDNSQRQLGTGTSGNPSKFTKVTSNINNDVIDVFCGDNHAFILKNDGTLWSCGDNYYGQLGLNNTTDKTLFTKVTTNATNIKHISCGLYTSYMLKNDGTLWTTGHNANGELGLGDLTNKSSFTKVSITNVKKVIAGRYYAVVLKNDGTAWACGYNTQGQFGSASITTLEPIKSFIQIAENVKDISCGYSHIFILKNDETVWASGLNSFGQLGLGNTTTCNTFTRVTTNVDNVNEIICGENHTFILKNDGSVWACGNNDTGQLGLDNSTRQQYFVQPKRGI